MFERIADKRLEQFGVSASQLRVAMLIKHLKSPTASQLATTIGSNPAATVRTLDRLEKMKWIKRIRSTKDRRIINLAITPKAKEIVEQLMPQVCEFLNTSLSGVMNLPLHKKYWVSSPKIISICSKPCRTPKYEKLSTLFNCYSPYSMYDCASRPSADIKTFSAN